MCVCVCFGAQEAVSDTLEELWISYNNIEKLKGITALVNLRVSQLVGVDTPLCAHHC